ncbi:hypothetical protein NMG60_11014219 [Bertholletia excelsa]
MGKYLRKAKVTGDVAVMEVVSPASLGVRTRAKTLALQRLQSTSTTAAAPPTNPESSYLQLRSRRLEKLPPPLNESRKQQRNQQHSAQRDGCAENPNPNRSTSPGFRASSRLGMKSVNTGSVDSASVSCSKSEEGQIIEFKTRANREDETVDDDDDLGVEPSSGENNLDFDDRDRSTRESTPCSLIRQSEDVGTPCSTTRQTTPLAADRRARNGTRRSIPTAHEMEDFFARAEQEEQRLFLEKYNFDVVNDLPLPGRYEWMRVNP